MSDLTWEYIAQSICWRNGSTPDQAQERADRWLAEHDRQLVAAVAAWQLARDYTAQDVHDETIIEHGAGHIPISSSSEES